MDRWMDGREGWAIEIGRQGRSRGGSMSWRASEVYTAEEKKEREREAKVEGRGRLTASLTGTFFSLLFPVLSLSPSLLLPGQRVDRLIDSALFLQIARKNASMPPSAII